MMRLLTIIILYLGLLGSSFAFAQTQPSGMSYQAVLRNSSGGLIMNQNVSVKISIRQGDDSGVIVYAEEQKVKTNRSGLLSFIIGNGIPIQGDFYTIDWAQGPYFLQTETDPNGGINYVLSSTTQLLSVPYAYYAAKSGDSFSGDYNDLINVPEGLVKDTELANVAISGDYADLQNTPELGMQVTGPDETGLYSMQFADGENAFGNVYTIKVPVKVSELNNDAAYLTNVDLSLIFEDNEWKLVEGKANKVTLPSRLSQFQNDKFFIDKSDLNLQISNTNNNVLELRDRNDSIITDVNLPVNTTGGGTQLPEGVNEGDLLYWNNKQWEVLPAGMEGQVLTFSSSGLTWSNPTIFKESELFKEGDTFINSRGEVEGIIVSIDPVKRTGLLVALEDLNSVWSTEYDLVGASSWKYGSENLEAVSQQPNWYNTYPGFEAVADKPGNWYIPAFNEMRTIISQKDELNAKLTAVQGQPLSSTYYLSSTEKLTSEVYGVCASKDSIGSDSKVIVGTRSTFVPLKQVGDTIKEFCYKVNPGDTVVIKKDYKMNIRPVRQLSWTELHSKVAETKIYKVGDIYYASDNQTPLGVVFEISKQGESGKIISLEEKQLQWCTEKNDSTHGMYSVSGMENVQLLTSHPTFTQEKYPAVTYCMETMPWYMPSLSELKSLTTNFKVVQQTLKALKDNGKNAIPITSGENYLSSTESSDANSEDKVMGVVINQVGAEEDVDIVSIFKNEKHRVRAIREF